MIVFFVLGLVCGCAAMVIVWAMYLAPYRGQHQLTDASPLQQLSYSLAQLRETSHKAITFNSTFARLHTAIEEQYHYADRLTGDLIDYAMMGYVAGLRDPHSAYLRAADVREFDDELDGSTDLVGIGIRIQPTLQGIRIDEVIANSPAASGGLLPTDMIVMIDKTPVIGSGASQVVPLIRGPVGSTVSLTIVRHGEEIPRVFDLVRADLHVPNVRTDIWEINNTPYGYVRIDSMGEGVATQVEESISSLSGRDTVQGVILDLRNNAGGFLDEGAGVASCFLGSGDVVAQSTYRSFPDQLVGATPSYCQTPWRDLPVVILVNKGTASASEILAGALQFYGAALVGGTTFGKGTIQQLITLDEGASVKLTVGERLLPDRSRVGTGLTIDVAVDQSLTGQHDESLWRAGAAQAFATHDFGRP